MSQWKRICSLQDIPRLGARVVKLDRQPDIAVFRDADDAVFALHDRCPHKQGPLSQGIVTAREVTCPLHGWKIRLDSGEAVAPDSGCVPRLALRVEGEDVFLQC